MTLLVIETSGGQGSLALCRGERCLAEVAFPPGLVHGREIAARTQEILLSQGLKTSDLSAIAVSRGPGSFTGIRVGVTAAKTLAFALRIAVIPESSLRVLAARVAYEGSEVGAGPAGAGSPRGDLVLAAVDGRKSHVFAGLYRVDSTVTGAEGGMRRLLDDALFDTRRLLDLLAERCRSDPERAGRVVIVGDGAEPFLQERSRAESPPWGGEGWQVVRAPREWDVPRARILGRLVAPRAAAASFDEEAIHRLEPDYLRLSDAEIRWDSR